MGLYPDISDKPPKPGRKRMGYYSPQELGLFEKVGDFPTFRIFLTNRFYRERGTCTGIRGYGPTNRTGDKMSRSSWNVGFTPDDGKDTVLGEDVSYRKGMAILMQYAQENLEKSCIISEVCSWELLVADIKDLLDDPGIMDDPDSWEDEDFYGPAITIWIVEN